GTSYLQERKRRPKNLCPRREGTMSPEVRRMPVFNVPARSTSSVNGTDAKNGSLALSAPSQPKTFSVAPIPAVFDTSAALMPSTYGGIARRMSYAASARRVAAFNPAPYSGETVNLNIGTIPAG